MVSVVFLGKGAKYMLHVYTGNGKGKTTAAIGLAVRALGAGKKVYFLQFMKSLAYSEQKILQEFSPQLRLQTTGKPFFIAEEGSLSKEEQEKWGQDLVIFPPGKPPAEYKQQIADGIQEAAAHLQAIRYDLLVLDEINMALFFSLLDRETVEKFLQKYIPSLEIVCTGRKAPAWLVEMADLVTEMKEVKHYYQQGISARRGIEN